MIRSLGAIVLYVITGTALTLFVYRVVLEGALAPADAERSLDGLIVFFSIVLNTALVFAAAAVATVMAAQSRLPFVMLLVISAGIVGLVGTGMMFWFTGLGWAYPVVMALNGGLSAFMAARLGLFRAQG